MPFEIAHDCTFTGPAFPDPFVHHELENELTKARLLPKATGDEGRSMQESWEVYRRKLRELIALVSPASVQAVPELIEKARLQQTRVTKELRRQAREAVELFVQEVLDHPDNRETLAAHEDKDRLARDLWREGLVLIYRLLFILKLESSDDPARAFSFASTSLWRRTFSPSVALAGYVREVLDRGAETGRFLESGVRTLFCLFTEGLHCTELRIAPLGGALFGEHATPLLSKLRWGERAVACLLDRLLWTPKQRGGATRERVHYGPLDVEDLGRVYEALLELEPGIATERMCRLRRQKLEVVVLFAQGERYRLPRSTRLTGEGVRDASKASEASPEAVPPSACLTGDGVCEASVAEPDGVPPVSSPDRRWRL